MFKSFKRKAGVLGLAATSVLPNASKVNFMGERAVRTAVAVEQAVASEAAAATEAGVAGSRAAASVAVAGGGTVAVGGFAAERECGVGATKLVSSGEKVAASEEIGALAGRTAATDGTLAAEETAALRAGRLPMRFPLAVPFETGPRAVASEALAQSGFHISGAAASEATVADLSHIILRQESVSLATEVIEASGADLQSNRAVAVAFERAFGNHTALKCSLDRTTGLVRVAYTGANGVLTAEFNAYTMAKAAAAAGVAVPMLNSGAQHTAG